jgi:hypothetical protein
MQVSVCRGPTGLWPVGVTSAAGAGRHTDGETDSGRAAWHAGAALSEAILLCGRSYAGLLRAIYFTWQAVQTADDALEMRRKVSPDVWLVPAGPA